MFEYNSDFADELDKRKNASVSLPIQMFRCHLDRVPKNMKAFELGCLGGKKEYSYRLMCPSSL
ncbi:putative betaine-aldehyde dehydrogenase [Helianthus annuus]|nr:putative betaine-aldehyde dehydrogenase [Helianthus annuus]